MQCPSCGSQLDASGVFPGGTLKCAACGAMATVPSATSSGSPASFKAAEDRGEAPTSKMSSLAPAPPACPRCNVELEIRDAEGTVVAACTGGHGLFVTRAALREVQSAGIAAASALDPKQGAAPVVEEEEALAPSRTLMCPRCGDAMTRRLFGNGSAVIVDVCAEHGTWFDAGELRAVVSITPEAARRNVENEELQSKQAKATLDVALALEQAREAETMRRAVDVTDDLLDTFNVVVLGRSSTSKYRRGW